MRFVIIERTMAPESTNGANDSSGRWYYADSANQPRGPITRQELDSLATSGEISAETLVIREGDSEWRRYDLLLPTLKVPPLPQPANRQSSPPRKRQIFFGVALGLSLLFCAPIGIVWAALSKRLSTREKIGACGFGILIFFTLYVPTSCENHSASPISYTSSSSSEGNTTSEPADGNAQNYSSYSESETGPISEATSSKNQKPESSNPSELTSEQALQLVESHSDHLEMLLNTVAAIPKEIVNSPEDISQFIKEARQANKESTTLRHEIIEELQPQLDRLGGEFHSIGGSIGSPLADCATEAHEAASELVAAICLMPRSYNQAAFENADAALRRAQVAFNELKRGIAAKKAQSP